MSGGVRLRAIRESDLLGRTIVRVESQAWQERHMRPGMSAGDRKLAGREVVIHLDDGRSVQWLAMEAEDGLVAFAYTPEGRAS